MSAIAWSSSAFTFWTYCVLIESINRLISSSTVHRSIESLPSNFSPDQCNPIQYINMDRLKIAVVCSSNMNRSMEAHSFLSKKGFNVRSFGTGTQVKLPGSAPDRPNTYDFSTTYADIYKDLVSKDRNLYTQNGMLNMLDRNRRIKPRPERFQDFKEQFNVIICAQERVYDQVVEDLECREKKTNDLAHIINIDIEDNHDEATIGAFLICELCALLEATDDLDNDIDEILLELEMKFNRTILHTVCFY